jgi:hypothetical protein
MSNPFPYPSIPLKACPFSSTSLSILIASARSLSHHIHISFSSPSPQGCWIHDRPGGMRHHKQPFLDFRPSRRIREVNEIKPGPKPSHPGPPTLNCEVQPVEGNPTPGLNRNGITAQQPLLFFPGFCGRALSLSLSLSLCRFRLVTNTHTYIHTYTHTHTHTRLTSFERRHDADQTRL